MNNDLEMPSITIYLASAVRQEKEIWIIMVGKEQSTENITIQKI